MIQHFNDTGDFRYVAKDGRVQVEIRTTCEFHVQLNAMLHGPNSATDRYYKIMLEDGDELDVFCSERYSITIKDLPHRGEVHDGESLVEVLEPHEMSLYDRLRADMLQEVSKIAHKHDLDSYEDDGDLDWDDDGDTPFTPYEYHEMQEEFLSNQKDSPKQEEASSVEAVEEAIISDDNGEA